MSVSIATRPALAFGNPIPVSLAYRGITGLIDRGPAYPRNVDITPDGAHFLGVVSGESNAGGTGTSAGNIEVVLNWTEQLKQRVAPR